MTFKTEEAGWADRKHVFHGLGLTAAVVGLGIAFSILNPRFMEFRNILNILTQASPFLIMAVGMTFVIVTGGIDLSVGAILAVVSVACFEIIKTQPYPFIGIALMFGLGILVGAFNGFLVAYIKIPPFIVTLGTMVSLRGVALLHSAGTMHHGLPESVVFLGQGQILGLPVPILIAVFIALLGFWLLNYTRFGVYSRALGGNREAAHFAGIRTRLIEFLVYSLMGLIVGIGGLVMVARIDSTQATIGTGMEIHVIAAVIIGGTSLFGGRGSIYGSVMGAVLLSMVTNALVIGGFDFFWQLVATGFIVVLAAAVENLREGRLADWLTTRKS